MSRVSPKEAAAMAMIEAHDTEAEAKEYKEEARNKVLDLFKDNEKITIDDRTVTKGLYQTIDTSYLALLDYLDLKDLYKSVRSTKIDLDLLRSLAKADPKLQKLVSEATNTSYKVIVK